MQMKKAENPIRILSLLIYMRKMGLEPTQAEAYKNLNLARLPIPTLPRDQYLFYQVFLYKSIKILRFIPKSCKFSCLIIFFEKFEKFQKFSKKLLTNFSESSKLTFVLLRQYKFHTCGSAGIGRQARLRI